MNLRLNVLTHILILQIDPKTCLLVNKIIGGQPSDSLSWPWQAHLTLDYQTSEGIRQLFCGATLISDQYLVTAGHCVSNSLDKSLLSVRVTLGQQDLSKTDVRRVEIEATKVIHSDSSNDIALVQLSRPVRIDGNESYVQAIQLPTDGQVIDGQNCYATGWGKLEEGAKNTSLALMQVRLPLIADSACQLVWRRRIDLRRYLCAGFLDGQADTCQGDSGGPLQCRSLAGQTSGKWVLVGVTSTGYGCARLGFPGIYTRVSRYVDWVRRYVTGN